MVLLLILLLFPASTSSSTVVAAPQTCIPLVALRRPLLWPPPSPNPAAAAVAPVMTAGDPVPPAAIPPQPLLDPLGRCSEGRGRTGHESCLKFGKILLQRLCIRPRGFNRLYLRPRGLIHKTCGCDFHRLRHHREHGTSSLYCYLRLSPPEEIFLSQPEKKMPDIAAAESTPCVPRALPVTRPLAFPVSCTRLRDGIRRPQSHSGLTTDESTPHAARLDPTAA